MSRAIIESLCSPAVVGGGALEAVLILGRLVGANFDNHPGFVFDVFSPSGAFPSTGEVASETDPILSPVVLSSYISDVTSCCSSCSSSLNPTSLNIDCRPLRMLLTIGNVGSLEPSLRRSDVTCELNLGRPVAFCCVLCSEQLWEILVKVMAKRSSGIARDLDM